MTRLDSLRAQLNGPRDGALLRFALATALLDAGQAADAIVQLRAAVDFDAGYSAAWNLLGKTCLAAGDDDGARTAWQRGVACATARGEVQAANAMQVFLRRLEPPR